MKRSIVLMVLIGAFALSGAVAQTEKQIKVQITTEYGKMVAVLYNETPKHRDNFVKLVKEVWYENSPFHRIIKDFMILGGQNADGRVDPGYKITAEFVPAKFHKKGALAAARQADQVNPEKASSGSQFYIVQGTPVTAQSLETLGARTGVKYTPDQIKTYTSVGGTPHLDGTYTVFGEVIEGLDVIDKIAAVKTAPGDKPMKTVAMSIKILE